MRRMLPQLGRLTRIVIAVFSFIGILGISTVAGYVAIAFGLMLFPVNSEFQNAGEVRVGLRSNGIHLDLILPVAQGDHDWKTVFSPADFQSLPRELNYVAIGWGDADFYLNTPTWRDVSIKTAVLALFGQNPSLLHVEYLAEADFETAHLRIDPADYTRLVGFISSTVRESTDSAHAQVIPGASYFGDDAFFEATGSYSAVHTCNSWVGDALRVAGVRMGIWTPFPANVTGVL